MTSQRIKSSHDPLSLSSQLPSPIEEDLSKSSAWEDQVASTLVPSGWKGKGQQLKVDDEDEEEDEDEDEDEDDDDDDTETVNGDSIPRRGVSYPPVAEEDLESRKIEENLKRWETLEKQRRKRARESRLSSHKKSDSISSTFIISDVSKRASQLWTRDKSRQDRSNPHQVLQDAEESPAINPPSALSPNRTPRSSMNDDSLRASPVNENPFENPEYAVNVNSTVSLNSPPATPITRPNALVGSVDKGKGKYPGPPQPLDLPVLVTLPADHSEQRGELELEVGGRRRAWWTEWICGCREEGDEQAARTNPME